MKPAWLVPFLLLAPALPLAAQDAPAPDEKKADPRREWLERFNDALRKGRSGSEPGAPAPEGGEEPEEPKADPIKTLEDAAKLMEEAEEYLNSAASRKALAAGAQAAEKLQLPKPPGGARPPEGGPPPGGAVPQALEKQDQARQKLDNLLAEADKKQRDTIDLINLLIKQARSVQFQGSPKPGPPQSKPSSSQSQPQNSPNAGNPAQRPYTPPPSSDASPTNRTTDPTDRWGDLPPHMRDEAHEGRRQVDEFPAEYRDLLEEYYKRLSGEP